MTNQEIFETLSENESKLAYAYFRDPAHDEKLKAAWDAAKNALITFAEATGCHN
jgi:hypothetical protein